MWSWLGGEGRLWEELGEGTCDQTILYSFFSIQNGNMAVEEKQLREIPDWQDMNFCRKWFLSNTGKAFHHESSMETNRFFSAVICSESKVQQFHGNGTDTSQQATPPPLTLPAGCYNH